MSTGQDCGFVEREPNKWYLLLEDYSTPKYVMEYNEYGPFKTWVEADEYLRYNFANPGGFWIDAHPDSTDRSWE